jgi:hypothetical protein
MGETHLLVEGFWQSHFLQSMAREAGGPLSVRNLREWTDQPNPRGLPSELQNLAILAFAAQTQRRFVQSGGPFEPDVDRLPDDVELREQALPSSADWQRAHQRAASLFGLVVPETLNVANVGKLVADVKAAASARQKAVDSLLASVTDRAAQYAPGEPGPRQRTAQAARSLLGALVNAPEDSLVTTLASASFETADAAMAHTIAQAQSTADALSYAQWPLLKAVRDLNDHRRADAVKLSEQLAELLRADEHVIPLKTKLAELVSDATALLTQRIDPPPPPPPDPNPVGADFILVEEDQKENLNAAAARHLLQTLKSKLDKENDLELTLHWRLWRKGGTQP